MKVLDPVKRKTGMEKEFEVLLILTVVLCHSAISFCLKFANIILKFYRW